MIDRRDGRAQGDGVQAITASEDFIRESIEQPTNPVGIDVVDSGAVLGDVGERGLVGSLGAELTLHEIVTNRRPRTTVQSTILGEDRSDALLGSPPRDTPAVIPRPGNASAMNR